MLFYSLYPRADYVLKEADWGIMAWGRRGEG